MAQKLNIPNLGTLLVLAEDWTFRLYFERRNSSMFDALGAKKSKAFHWPKPEDFAESNLLVEYEPAMSKEELELSYRSYRATNSQENPFVRVTLPKGTQLKIDRIYIRRGSEAFNSVTFRTTKACPDKRFANKRFWTKLRDANAITADILG